ncbi:hypothetical protein JWJ90_21905 [Desulfobulbus rhabdoformis]|uniref:DUF1302 family protein n=1 Tax=Desulfobulbus rhabdoformis TaxID=34032 RepID=UPI00196607F5|nr:DUF1302 family protein [Desulfobulbus rhabdoformis]MBM9616920.1 hypothetical protein [Desulfobulbus rhabdoformis]
MRYLTAILLLFGWMSTTSCWANEEENLLLDRLELSGWAEAIQSMRIQSPNDSLMSRVKLRLELSADLDWLYGFFSGDAEKNWEIASETGVDLHEAWVEHVADNWDLRVGRQIIIWGKADGVQVTDMISPPDYTESITRELDEIRMPVDSVKFRWLGDMVDTELIWIPVFKAAVMASGDNPWALQSASPDGVTTLTNSTIEPDSFFTESEFALKISSYLSGLDLAASVFYTWDDFATRYRTVTSVGDNILVELTPRHERLTVFGLEGALPWSEFVFRAEAAYYKGRYYESESVYHQPQQKDGYKWLGGVDWTPGDDWSVTAQLIGDGILNHDDRLADPAHATMVTLNVSKDLLHQTLTVSNMLYWSVDDGEIFNRIKAEYEMRDGLHLSAGVDIFSGDDGQYGVYEDNSQVWVNVKYSF